MLDDREPEAGAAGRAGAIGAVEALEQPRQVVVCDARRRRRFPGARRGRPRRARRSVNVVPSPAYRIAFSARFEAMTRSIRGRIGTSSASSHSSTIRTPARAARSAISSTTSRSVGQARVVPSETTSRPGLELAEEENVVDQLADLADLGPRLRDRLGGVGAGKLCGLEQHEQPRERRAQLVGDGGGEPGAELLVGGELARSGCSGRRAAPAGRPPGTGRRPAAARRLRGAAPVPGAGPPRSRRASRGRAGSRRRRRRRSSRTSTISGLSSTRNLPRAASIGHVPPFGVLSAVPYAEAAHHHLLTESSLLWHPRSTPWRTIMTASDGQGADRRRR